MTFKKIFTFVSISIFSPCFAADNGFWHEGKDFPAERVNAGIKAVTPDAYSKIAEKIDGAVVNISSTQNVKPNKQGRPHGFSNPRNRVNPFDDFFGGNPFEKFFQMPEQQPRQSLGSGFILNSEGYIVTNNHVVEKADEIKVVLQDESTYTAKVIGKDPKTDVALIKIDAKKPLAHVILGDSSALKVGDIVVAIGNPFGLSHTVTQGIVSAKERTIGAGPYDDFIQTDASINPGNSGGPLLNLYGEVIGINSMINAAGQNIGFAIPINLAKDILLKLKDKGKVVRGWLGVMIQKITDEHATALKLKDRRGALVADVQKGSPAEKAGFKPGDVIVAFNAKPIKDYNELPLSVANTSIGKKVKVDLIRDGSLKSMDVVVEELKGDEAIEPATSEKQADPLGLNVEEITDQMAPSLGLDSGTKGVVVTDVDDGSAAAERGIQRGDVIVEIDRKKITSAKEYQEAVQGKKKGDNVLMLVKRGKGSALYVAFTL